MTDHKVDVHIARLQPGTLVDVVIKGVEFAYERTIDHSTGTFSIRDEHGRRYIMPPQAAITRAGEASTDDRIAAALRVLDAMEYDGRLQPYVAAAVRKEVGLPPRHWPPQPGDVWDDGFPSGFIASQWFAQAITRNGGPAEIVMVPVERGPEDAEVKTPEELMADAIELTLVYRKDGGQ
ncbi:hypothetical protein ACIBQX_18960 [Nonomuraea sp. NPDC049714]|uniref:hypothetical protein n=1 Tax=Nonomuraea sp. NPDC049714 TaxID=3364357 RepID=UPI003791E8C3